MSNAVMSLQAIKAKLQELQMQQQQPETKAGDLQTPATSSLTFTNPLNTSKSLDLTGGTGTSTSSSNAFLAQRLRFSSGEALQPGTGQATQGHAQPKQQSGGFAGSRKSTLDLGSDPLRGTHVCSSSQSGTHEIVDSNLSSGVYSHARQQTMETGSHSTIKHHPSGMDQSKSDAQSRDSLPTGVLSATSASSMLVDADASATSSSPKESTDTQHTATVTFEVEDHKARMKRIETEGNSPEEWKGYIDFLKTIASNSDVRRRPLSEAYSRAFYGILNTREHKNSEVFVRLIMDYVQFKSERFEWDSVDTILDMARSYVQSFAVITVASAEVKILKGDHEKALSVLTKALGKGRAQPKELIIRAIKATEAGQCKLLTDAERKLEASGIFGRHNSQDCDEFKVPGGYGLSHSHTDTHLERAREQGPNVAPTNSQSASNLELPLPAQPPSASKPGMRHYSSTPEVRSAQRIPSSQLQSSKVKGNLGLPMRVRNPLQQHAVHMFSAEKEEDTDFINSIRPLQPLHSSTGRFTSPISTSGYQSDLTVPMEDANLSQVQGSALRDVFSPNNSAVSRKAPADVKRNPPIENEQPPATVIKTGPPLITVTQAPHQHKPSAAENSVTDGHHRPSLQPVEAGDGGGKKSPVLLSSKPHDANSNMPPAPAVVSAPAVSAVSNWQGAVPVMSTPSCKGQQMQATVAPTPNGEFIETVIVNGEQYHVLKKVGRGGSAQVYMVFDAKKNVRALKVVDLEGAGPEVIDGFRNEISLLQRLQYCDSVIKMYNFEYNEKLNRLYVILEFGETDLSGFFATRAKQQRGLDPTMIKFYWTEMLVAVNALHREGIIHSDLKPANFMLVAGNLKLIDFGIANALQQDKTSVLKDSRVGTPSYMSPEAIMAACDDGMDDSAEEKENMGANARPKYKVGVRSDVWSLGCILYNMVYGRTPFQHIKNNMCKLQAITNPNCEIKFPSIPDAHLMDVLQKCLTRDVKLRPTTQELLDHPYLTSDKDTSQNQTPPRDQGKASKSSNINKTPENKGESKILKELLQSKLAEGSPGMQALITKLMKKMETGQNVDTRAVLLDANNGCR